ncbi:NUDIX hydrolase [Kineobactrum salinum]|uniref:NUDIX hydrolase n=2 Tax=Kineobactrum salinum TaxID=2708301 RepID=A0A6C0UC29_9GAMM|nr:NUDIX hydrolase [Kineobactrum salinum]
MERPIAASIAVLIRGGEVLLVRRGNRPDAGIWGFPGGKVEFGESIEQASIRELLEETGVHGEARQVITALDVFDRNPGEGLRQHFILIAVLCRWISGDPLAADDAVDARWFPVQDLDTAGLAMSSGVVRVLRQAQLLAADGPGQ